MTGSVASDFRSVIAHRIEMASRLLASRWLERLEQLVPVAAHDIFPGDQLLGHAPTLISELAAFLQAPEHDPIAANAVVTARATELGRLRHEQRATAHQVLREYRVLRRVIAQFIGEEIERLGLTPTPADVIDLMNRLVAATDVLLQTTMDTFVAEYTETITNHTASLEGFNRMVSHELRQPLNTLQLALTLLSRGDACTDTAKRDHLINTATRNVAQMSDTLKKLVQITWTGDGQDSALIQRVELTAVANDVIDQLKDMAAAKSVDVRIAGHLPAITIDGARIELILVNLVSNAIKYSDPKKPARTVEIASVSDEARPDVCTLTVRDNGIGVAEREMQSIFARFYRGHAKRDQELGASGLGLGLSIVADCVDAVNGTIRVESRPGEGTTFIVELPVAPR